LLYGDAFPEVRFSLHQESFGYILINRSQILKVARAARPLIDALEQGDRTLTEIDASFGQATLNFVGLLYDNRMIELANHLGSANEQPVPDRISSNVQMPEEQTGMGL